jgi:hypothetical protein
MDSHQVEIINTGFHNYDNGPDFRNAILKINQIQQMGDVEFHINLKDWFKHGHDEDDRYKNVILHCVWQVPAKIPPKLKRRCCHLVLSKQLNISYSKWYQLMLKCEKNRELFNSSIKQPLPLTDNLLKSLATRRFYRKADRFNTWLNYFSFDDVFMISLAEALGYSKNKFPFRQLLWQIPPSAIYRNIPIGKRSPTNIFIYYAIRANLISSKNFKFIDMPDSHCGHHFSDLIQYYLSKGYLPIMELKDWYFSRIRPVNNPIIRLASLSQILYEYQNPSLYQKLLSISMNRFPIDQFLSTVQSLLRLQFNQNLLLFLKHVLNLEHLPQNTIGKTRINQIFINGMLPILYLWAHRNKNEGFSQYIQWVYENLPSFEDNLIIKKIKRSIKDPRINLWIKESACMQQGLIEYFSINHLKQIDFSSIISPSC